MYALLKSIQLVLAGNKWSMMKVSVFFILPEGFGGLREVTFTLQTGFERQVALVEAALIFLGDHKVPDLCTFVWWQNSPRNGMS